MFEWCQRIRVHLKIKDVFLIVWCLFVAGQFALTLRVTYGVSIVRADFGLWL